MIENQDTILELTARIQELQNEINCINDSRDLKDAESVRSGLSHVPSQLALFPSYRDPDGMLSRSVGMLSRNNKPPDIWNTHGISGNFCKSNGVFFSTLSGQGFNPWISNTIENTYHRMQRVNVKIQTQLWIPDASQDRQPEIHSTLRREDFQRIMGRPTTTADFGTSF